MTAEDKTHLAPGYRLDRYELLCPLGVGGMASVWVARLLGKHGFEKLVAVKTILPTYARDPAFQRMFLDEARIAARIQHVNVAQILDLGDQHGVLYLVMEWVAGEALSKLARAVQEHGASFPPGVAARILVDVCAGLHAAHELRDRSGASLEIVHRDVSPHNILVGAQGVSKVIDFGIAKARDRAAGDTRTGSFKGKVKYMAPEQAVAPKSTDRRADIWAVGAVLYSVLAERSPYESENDMATLVQLAQQKEPEPLPAGVPDPIRRLVAKALAWNADDRYPTAPALGEALEDAMVEAGIVTTSADVAAFCRLHLADRTEAREKAVAIGLSAAEERSRVAHLLTPEDDRSSPRLVRPSQPKLGTAGEPGDSSDRPTAALSSSSAQPETSPTLGAAATMTFNLPGGSRRRGIAVLVAAAAIAVVAVGALVHRSGGQGASSVASMAPPPETPPSVAIAVASATAVPAPPPAPTIAAAPAPQPLAQDTPPRSTSPSPLRRRPPPAANTTNHAQTTAPASSTNKHRSEYGF